MNNNKASSQLSIVRRRNPGAGWRINYNKIYHDDPNVLQREGRALDEEGRGEGK